MPVLACQDTAICFAVSFGVQVQPIFWMDEDASLCDIAARVWRYCSFDGNSSYLGSELRGQGLIQF